MVYVDDGAVDAAGRKPFMANEEQILAAFHYRRAQFNQQK